MKNFMKTENLMRAVTINRESSLPRLIGHAQFCIIQIYLGSKVVIYLTRNVMLATVEKFMIDRIAVCMAGLLSQGFGTPI